MFLYIMTRSTLIHGSCEVLREAAQESASATRASELVITAGYDYRARNDTLSGRYAV